MARNDTRRFRTESTNHALLGAGANTWRALANVTVTTSLAVALAVCVVALLDAVSKPVTKLTRSPEQPATQGWRAGTLQPVMFSNFCARHEPLSCRAD
jgi:hypothetical protein